MNITAMPYFHGEYGRNVPSDFRDRGYDGYPFVEGFQGIQGSNQPPAHHFVIG